MTLTPRQALFLFRSEKIDTFDIAARFLGSGDHEHEVVRLIQRARADERAPAHDQQGAA